MQIPNLPALLFKAIASAHEGLGISDSITPDCPLIYAVESKVNDNEKTVRYRVVQKDMGNIFKHEHATHVAVCVALAGNNLELLVNDNWVRV